jgi:ankyrin repeat protein
MIFMRIHVTIWFFIGNMTCLLKDKIKIRILGRHYFISDKRDMYTITIKLSRPLNIDVVAKIAKYFPNLSCESLFSGDAKTPDSLLDTKNIDRRDFLLFKGRTAEGFTRLTTQYTLEELFATLRKTLPVEIMRQLASSLTGATAERYSHLGELLKDLRVGLGYAESSFGLCNFYAEICINSFIAGINDYFNKLLNYIKVHHRQIPEQLQRAREESKPEFEGQKLLTDESREQLLEIAALFDQGELFKFPFEQRTVFGKALSSIHTQEIAPFAIPKKLENHGGRVEVASFSGIYSQEELTGYVQMLNAIAEQCQTDFAVSLTTPTHRCVLCYSNDGADTGRWFLFDINYSELPPVAASSENEAIEALVSNLVKIFSISGDTTYFACASRIIIAGNRQDSILPTVNAVLKGEKYRGLHEVDAERALRETSQGATWLWLAARENHTDKVKELLQAGAKVDQQECDKTTPLIIASDCGNTEVVEILLSDEKIDVDIKDKMGQTALHRAAKKEYLNISERLINAGANINEVDENGNTPLLLVSLMGAAKAVKMLLRNEKIDIHAKNFHHDQTALHIATIGGYPDIVQMLIDAGANVDEVDNSGRTPFLLASSNGHIQIADTLHTLTIDIHAKDKEGRTAIYLGVSNGHANTVSFLTSAGVNPNIPQNDSSTPVFIVAQYGYFDCVQALCDAKADIQIPFKSTPKNLIDFAVGHKKEINGIVERMEQFIQFKKEQGEGEIQEDTTIDMLPSEIAWIMGHNEIERYLKYQEYINNPSGIDAYRCSFFNTAPQSETGCENKSELQVHEMRRVTIL